MGNLVVCVIERKSDRQSEVMMETERQSDGQSGVVCETGRQSDGQSGVMCETERESDRQSEVMMEVERQDDREPEAMIEIVANDTQHAQVNNGQELDAEKTVNRSRKRKRQEQNWKNNIRKRLRQSGREYTDVRGNTVRKREIRNKKDCAGKCRFKCIVNVSAKERKNIFDKFWSYSDSGKNAFYAKHIEKMEKKRTLTKSLKSRRAFTYEYFFYVSSTKMRVCKSFFLSTLDISGSRLQWCFEEKDNVFEDERGKHVKRKVSAAAKKKIRDHINSFARIPSDYCR